MATIFVVLVVLTASFGLMATAVAGLEEPEEYEYPDDFSEAPDEEDYMDIIQNILNEEEERLEVTNVYDLQALSADDFEPMTEGVNIVLKDDIDASYTEEWHDGEGFYPIMQDDSPLEINFDGQGYTIEDLYIDSEETYVGLFQQLENSSVENLNIQNAEIHGEGSIHGTLAAETRSTDISTVAVTDSEITGFPGAGGLVGGDFEGESGDATTIHNVLIDADVHGVTQNGEDGYAAGVMGDGNAASEISDVMVKGSITGVGVAGVITYAYGDEADISNTVVTSELVEEDGDNNGSGAFAVVMNDEVSITDSYYDINATGTDVADDNEGGEVENVEGFETADLQGDEAENNLDALDFEDTWTTLTDDYVYLDSHIDSESESESSGTSSPIPSYDETMIWVFAGVTVAIVAMLSIVTLVARKL